MLRGIRGAITVENNRLEEVRNATLEMVEKILEENQIAISDIASITFTMTKDLDCAYPAKFAREIKGFESVPLMCYQELNIKNSLEKCIRALILVNCDKSQNEIKHIYLKKAKKLRPDLT